jgi:hypothetical protein
MARYAQKRSKVEGRESSADTAVQTLDTRRSTLDYFLALVFFALGLMSKPMLVTLPFVMLLLDYWPLPYGLVGWLWFLGTLVPVIGLVQVGRAALADRYTYFPSIGVFIVVAFAVRDWAGRLQLSPRVIAAAAVLMLAGCVDAHGKPIALLAR